MFGLIQVFLGDHERLDDDGFKLSFAAYFLHYHAKFRPDLLARALLYDVTKATLPCSRFDLPMKLANRLAIKISGKQDPLQQASPCGAYHIVIGYMS